MKIGIVTFHWAANYGAVLQTYALQNVLVHIGHQVDIINYRPTWARDNKIPRFSRRPREMINWVDHYLRKYKFKQFCKNELHLTTHTYQLDEKISGFDCVIVGSDQVFNPDIIASGNQLDTTYLLASVSRDTKRVSYAASFGNSTLASEYWERFRQLLSSFSFIGIREKSGKHIVEALGLKAAAVPDPTILWGDFSLLANLHSLPADNYVLNFIFQQTEAVRMAQDVIAMESSKPIRSVIGLSDKLKGKSGYYNLSPEQWIKTIGNAHFVITDSFHSTVFCILTHRPFVSLVLNAWGGDWSERIKALLVEVGLEDRLLPSPTQEAIRDIYYKTIDWGKVEKKLTDWRIKGEEFLRDCLNS
ncbi:polysaccharide pyruvyl transferase family protein [Parabacteroides sp.]